MAIIDVSIIDSIYHLLSFYVLYIQPPTHTSLYLCIYPLPKGLNKSPVTEPRSVQSHADPCEVCAHHDLRLGVQKFSQAPPWTPSRMGPCVCRHLRGGCFPRVCVQNTAV